jgi:AcrR family transcriptional regulator
MYFAEERVNRKRSSGANGAGNGARGDATRQKIVLAAHESIQRFGSKRITIEDVAQRARVSRPTVYAYFESKSALIDAALIWNAHLFRIELEKRLASAATFADKVAVAAVFGATSDSLKLSENEPETKALLMTIYSDPLIERASQFWKPIIQEGMDRGEVRSDLDPMMTAQWVAHSLFMLALMVPPSPTRKILKEVDEYARTFIADGLAYHPR